MIRVYRLASERFEHHPTAAMSGEGGLYGPARWHPKGHRIVYLAQSLALCTLEMKVQDSDINPLYAGFEIEVPDSVGYEVLDQGKLPHNWRDRIAYPICQAIGESWLTARKTALLLVPSAVVPSETNYLLNPLHPDAKKIVTRPLGLLATDPRLLPPNTR
jgi:RES domain-containing protein